MSVTPMTSGTTTAQPKYRLPREAGLTDSEAEPPRVAATGNARVAVFPPAGG